MPTRYAVRFEPSFHPETEIEVLFGPEGEFVRVRTRGHGERVALQTEPGVRFLDAVEALAPDSIADGWEGGIDGCFFTCSVRRPDGREHVFKAWSPDPERSPSQHAFISSVYRIAWEAVRKPETVAVLEQLFGYFDGGLPARVIQGEPLCIRIFGGLSISHEEPLKELFTSVPPEAPVLMDLTNLRGMGTVLYPCFLRFHQRPGLTAWLVNDVAMRQLRGAGVPSESMFRDRADAVASLRLPT